MMNWNKLISTKRLGNENIDQKLSIDSRSEFQRDFDRIIFSSPFRRLQNKTQVFPLPENIFVHNRLTHSLEVASVGRSLGNLLSEYLIKNEQKENPLFSEIGSIVSSACLAHDMGNPPFGHSGEEAISFYFLNEGKKWKEYISAEDWTDFTNFEGNANAFRLLTHQFSGRKKGGFGLTYSTLISIVKYPYGSDPQKKKFGFFNSEKNTYIKIAKELGISTNSYAEYNRHPLVLLVEAADDICYQIMDTEDAHKLGILSTEETKNIFLNFFDNKEELKKIHKTMLEVSDKNEQIAYLRAKTISRLIKECIHIFISNEERIMSGNFHNSLIKSLEGQASKAMENCIDIAINKIYRYKHVIEIELTGYKILGTLLETFINAVLNTENRLSEKLTSLIPPQYNFRDANKQTKIRSIVDFISGMTDTYALDLYRKITGISVPGIR